MRKRPPDSLREIQFQPGIAPHAAGSVLVSFGNTRVICAATIEEGVPRWMKEQGVSGGWITAEYSMLPYSTHSRKARESTRGKLDGRGVEIQRLIGRALRAAVNLEALGPRTLWIDCDVLQADGGTRTAAITGACVATSFAVQKLLCERKLCVSPIAHKVAAVSLGIVGGQALLDLNYEEDKNAAVDLNLVMTESLDLVELQVSGEEAVFNRQQLDSLLDMGVRGIQQILELQTAALHTAPE
jgi:ribonuclease PH